MSSKEMVEFGRSGEWSILNLLRYYKRRAIRTSRSFDILVDEKIRVEVKTARPRKHKAEHILWQFNIHRHGKIPKDQPDVYVLRLEGIPSCQKAVHLLIRGPVSQYAIQVGLRSLLNQQWHTQVEDFYSLLRGTLSL
jgi:hypothetical protein